MEPVKKVKKVRKARKKRTQPTKPNAWLMFVKQYREENPGESYKQALKSASVAYKKSKEVTV